MQSIVETRLGKIQGFRRGDVFSFFGVPYAKPPVGESRFAAPQPLTPSTDVLDATQHGFIAPQGPSDLDATMGSFVRHCGEDCLTLTINVPVDVDEAAEKLPVAVWFHGGANMSGAGSLDWYDGAVLASRGRMVVVGVNFRLAALGFLWHPALNTENRSILDQIAALRWIQENIAAFGGDANNVTVFGQSAGGNAIAHMTALPETEGLFQKIILESPSIGRGNHLAADAERIAECVFRHLGLNAAQADFKAQILAKTTDEILAATDAAYAELGAEFGGMLFKPVKDEWHTPEATAESAAKEAARRGLRVMIGTTADEMFAFVRPKTPEEEKRIRRAQFERYDLPDDTFARVAAAGGALVWKYRFDWCTPKAQSPFGACHTIELPFVFGTLDAWKDSPMLAGADRREMEKLSDVMIEHWCRFANKGDFEADDWPRFTCDRPVHKIFDNQENGCQLIDVRNSDENTVVTQKTPEKTPE